MRNTKDEDSKQSSEPRRKTDNKAITDLVNDGARVKTYLRQPGIWQMRMQQLTATRQRPSRCWPTLLLLVSADVCEGARRSRLQRSHGRHGSHATRTTIVTVRSQNTIYDRRSPPRVQLVVVVLLLTITERNKQIVIIFLSRACDTDPQRQSRSTVITAHHGSFDTTDEDAPSAAV